MATLIVANTSEERLGDLFTDEQRKGFGWAAQRLVWYARAGDVVVLPSMPDRSFMTYVTGLTGTPQAALTILVPPPGTFGPDLLTADRLCDKGFREQLRSVLATRPIDDIVRCYPDYAVADLACAMGIENALPGHRFSAQEGAALVNSKAAFRAVAAGSDVPTAPGVVTRHRPRAEAAINALLDAGHPVMVKRDFAGGGFGNEILSRGPGVRAVGARNVVVLADAAEVASYLERRWSWLTAEHRDQLVIERFVTDALTVYAEFNATDAGCALCGTGELLVDRLAVGEIIPPQTITEQAHARLVELARRLCERFQLIGYRGTMSADAIVAPGDEVMFTETNGRMTSSTYLLRNIIGHVVGARYRGQRVFMERAGRLTVSSFPEAIDRLRTCGLAYDPDTGTGVILTASYVPVDGTAMYCVVAEDHGSVRAIEARLLAAFA